MYLDKSRWIASWIMFALGDTETEDSMFFMVAPFHQAEIFQRSCASFYIHFPGITHNWENFGTATRIQNNVRQHRMRLIAWFAWFKRITSSKKKVWLLQSTSLLKKKRKKKRPGNQSDTTQIQIKSRRIRKKNTDWVLFSKSFKRIVCYLGK